jgi:glycosyltransferase involved in cell wall biosynthesis
LQYQVKWLAEEMARQGIEIYLLTPNNSSTYLEMHGGFPKNVSLNFSKNYPLNTINLWKAMHYIKPDVIHTHSVLPDTLMAVFAKHRKTPLVTTSHGMDIAVVKEFKYGYRLNPLASIAIRLALKICDKHIVPSDAMVKFATEAGSNREKIIKIPNGTPPRKEVAEEKVELIKEKYNMQDNCCILTLSGMRPIKGLEYLIRALPIVLKEHNIHLLMACKGEYEVYIKALIEKLNLSKHMMFLGFVSGDEKLALLKACDIFCVPSVFESFGIVILEAMQYGKPVVASEVGGMPEIIEKGKNGLLVPPKDSQKLADAICLLLDDENLRRTLGREAERSVSKYSIKVVAQKYIKIYEEILR